MDEEIPDDGGDDDMDSLSADLDFPTMDDLDDDLDDNFTYEGDAVLQDDGEAGMPLDDGEQADDAEVGIPLDDGEQADDAGQDDDAADQDINEHASVVDTDDAVRPTTDDGEEQRGEEAAEAKAASEQDFDSLAAPSSTQDDDAAEVLDVEQQVKESRNLINEIQTLVNPPPTARPVSSHSRVTFQNEPVDLERPESRDVNNEGGRKVLKPKSILVPRHIQPPPSVGLTIVQFQRGDDVTRERQGVAVQRTVHRPQSQPSRSRSSQQLTQSDPWIYDPTELVDARDRDSYVTHTAHHVDETRVTSSLQSAGRRLTAADSLPGDVRLPKSLHTKPRMFTRSFPPPKPQSAPQAAGDAGLALHGDAGLAVQGLGGRSHSAVTSARSAGVAPLRARSASQQKMIKKQDQMLRRAPTAPHRTAPSIPSGQDGALGRLEGQGPFSAEHDSHARKEQSPRRYMEKGEDGCKMLHHARELFLSLFNHLRSK